VRLNWLENYLFTPFFRRAILIPKLGQLT